MFFVIYINYICIVFIYIYFNSDKQFIARTNREMQFVVVVFIRFQIVLGVQIDLIFVQNSIYLLMWSYFKLLKDLNWNSLGSNSNVYSITQFEAVCDVGARATRDWRHTECMCVCVGMRSRWSRYVAETLMRIGAWVCTHACDACVRVVSIILDANYDCNCT